MRRDRLIALGLVAAVAGCSARADSERREADEAGDIRIDREAVRALLTPAPLVSVVGTARVSVEPDVAEVSVGVASTRPTAPEAMQVNNQKMTGLIESLKRRGVAPKDIQTSQLSIWPQYSRAAEAKPGVPEELTVAKVVGYEVVNTVRVTSRDRARIGDLIGAAIEAGSNQMYGISFRVDDRDREALLADLRAKAFDSAKAKAELYARRAGMTLGPVGQITESDQSGPLYPAPMGPNVMPAPMAPSTPVSAGEQEVSLSVSVSFELIAPKR